ncbi:hypothetical protein TNIN_60911 [Trichonephila inaurata madagascariensis]|uniref:Mutator-like transposase domain-containing protein n=1 Tax=Trichonephila inaurata madagascariensis TaxID=2747483 RepID=A0A8X6YQQ5_9ARAC|nr:hypothetical protein TNIN_60911 [Trichonephila inaurata madagascariensis]
MTLPLSVTFDFLPLFRWILLSFVTPRRSSGPGTNWNSTFPPSSSPPPTSHHLYPEDIRLFCADSITHVIGIKNIPEINKWSVSAIRYIGQGLSSLETFCSLMCLPNPVCQKAYDRINAKIADVSETLANASMKKAAAEEKNIEVTVNSVV